MKVAIMQPYFFPYLGYFQLIHSVNAFVVYDDVNFIKGGWINRNYILGQGKRQRITIPLLGASQNKLINQIDLVGCTEKVLKSIQRNYAKAPCFASVFPLIEELLHQPERNLAKFLDISLRQICAYLGLSPTWHISSALDTTPSLRGQDRILHICQSLGTDQYINLPGGRVLYDPVAFAERGIKLLFVEPTLVEYRQFGEMFVPGLSILDVMMFNDSDCCRHLLREYRLV